MTEVLAITTVPEDPHGEENRLHHQQCTTWDLPKLWFLLALLSHSFMLPQKRRTRSAVWDRGVLASCPWKQQESRATEEQQGALSSQGAHSPPPAPGGSWICLLHCGVFAAPASIEFQGQKIPLSCSVFKIYLLIDNIISKALKREARTQSRSHWQNVVYLVALHRSQSKILPSTAPSSEVPSVTTAECCQRQ